MKKIVSHQTSHLKQKSFGYAVKNEKEKFLDSSFFFGSHFATIINVSNARSIRKSPAFSARQKSTQHVR